MPNKHRPAAVTFQVLWASFSTAIFHHISPAFTGQLLKGASQAPSFGPTAPTRDTLKGLLSSQQKRKKKTRGLKMGLCGCDEEKADRSKAKAPGRHGPPAPSAVGQVHTTRPGGSVLAVGPGSEWVASPRIHARRNEAQPPKRGGARIQAACHWRQTDSLAYALRAPPLFLRTRVSPARCETGRPAECSLQDFPVSVVGIGQIPYRNYSPQLHADDAPLRNGSHQRHQRHGGESRRAEPRPELAPEPGQPHSTDWIRP